MLSRSTTALMALACLGAVLPAQDQKTLEQQRADKQAKAVFAKAPWTFDYDKARAEAKKTGKPIFAYFTRSYAH